MAQCEYRRGTAARFAFKLSLVVMRKGRLDSSEPHRHAALSAKRVFYLVAYRKKWTRPEMIPSAPPVGFAGVLSQSPTPVGSAAPGDASNLIAKKALVCLPANIGSRPDCIAGD